MTMPHQHDLPFVVYREIDRQKVLDRKMLFDRSFGAIHFAKGNRVTAEALVQFHDDLRQRFAIARNWRFLLEFLQDGSDVRGPNDKKGWLISHGRYPCAFTSVRQ